jgi:hypothetical protein
MKTQKEQIGAATHALAIPLNHPEYWTSLHRYAIYLVIDGKNEELWPSDSHLGKKSLELLPYQTFSLKGRTRAYHFCLTEYGTDHRFLLERMLRESGDNPLLRLNIA